MRYVKKDVFYDCLSGDGQSLPNLLALERVKMTRTEEGASP